MTTLNQGKTSEKGTKAIQTAELDFVTIENRLKELKKLEKKAPGRIRKH